MQENNTHCLFLLMFTWCHTFAFLITNCTHLAVFNQMQLKYADSKVHGANMGPTWVLSAPHGPHKITCCICHIIYHMKCLSLCQDELNSLEYNRPKWFCEMCLFVSLPFNHIEDNNDFYAAVHELSKSTADIMPWIGVYHGEMDVIQWTWYFFSYHVRAD